MNDILSPLIEAVVSEAIKILVPLLVTAALGVLTQLYMSLRMRLGDQKLAVIRGIVYDVVMAAEQRGVKDALVKAGLEKKAWAIAEAQRILNERGIKVNVATLATLVETTVYDSLNRFPVQDAKLEIIN